MVAFQTFGYVIKRGIVNRLFLMTKLTAVSLNKMIYCIVCNALYYTAYTPPTTSTSPPTTVATTSMTQSSYPAGHTVIIVVCSVMGGLIVIFLIFLLISLCYFANGKTAVRHYKFPNSPDNSSRLSTESALAPSSDISLPTKSTNLASIDGTSYDMRHSESQSSIVTATTHEPLHPPPPTPTSRSKSVHFLNGGYGSAVYSAAPYDYEHDRDYLPPCPSVDYDPYEDDHISSVSERAERDYRLMRHHAQYYAEQDRNSVTTVETRHTYNTESCCGPPPSLASQSMFSHEDGESYYDYNDK